MKIVLYIKAFLFKNFISEGSRSINKICAAFIFFCFAGLTPVSVYGQAASSNYATQTGTLGTTYSWIDCSSGTTIVAGDDAQGSFSWPFTFSFYDNTYTTSSNLSVATNGFIRLDGVANTDYTVAGSYTLSSGSTELGQIIATSVYDCNVGRISSSWVRYLVTGAAPNRILTIEYSDIEIDYNDGRYANVQVSFYETLNKVVLKFGTDNVTASGSDMGIHSGVSGYFNKWQEVASGTNNSWIEYTRTSDPPPYTGPAASWNYITRTGTLGTTYSWVDCSAGSSVVSGDDNQASINWPFNFNFYDNSYTTSNSLNVCTNGFIRLDGIAATSYNAATAYDLNATATGLGQIVALAVYDGNVSGTGWVRSLVTGTAPSRIFTIEYNNLEIDYNDNKFASVQVSFYESSNIIVLKLGNENLNKNGVDMGLHSGVSNFFNKWQEVNSGTNNTWIEYTPPNIEVNATIGTSIAYYPTLKTAFDKINDGTHQGNLVVKINQSTTESASAVLNASGTGSANYSSVNIYPTISGLSISGDLSLPLIDLFGADNVTIDGRVNATGSTADLIIINSNVSTTSNTSTIRFITSAENNSIKYCTIKGGASGSYSGILLFAGSSSGNGNKGNTVEYCNISGINATDRPFAAIYSYGTTGRENSNNVISNNNFFDFLKPEATSYGIYVHLFSNSWILSGNSFYETTDFVSTSNASYYAVRVLNNSGNNFDISNNYFGGKAALCGGTAWSISSSLSPRFYAVHLDVGTTAASSVQGNTIRNFSISNSNNIPWMGIDANSGVVNIGTITGNIIGSSTGNGSVSITNSNPANSAISYGIYVNSPRTVVVSNNTIGSVTVSSANSVSHSFFGIYKVGNVSGDLFVTNNTIGSLTTANSIQANTVNTSGAAQNVYGIISSGTGTAVISSNTVANLFNAHAYQYANSGQVVGIYTSKGINTIQNNTVRNLTCTSPSGDLVGNAAVIGISQQSTSGDQIISGNTIYALSSTYTESRPVNVMGIFYFGGTSGINSISGNFIHSLNASTSSATITGIKVYAGTTTTANNIINLGEDISSGLAINGLYENGNAGNNNSMYFNTVYIGGTVSGTTSSTWALYSVTNNNARDFRNNILVNARSGGTSGSHYAIRVGGMSNVTINYNDYFISGSPSLLGQIGTQNKTTFTDWQLGTGQDANSLNTDPVFSSPGGTNSSGYITSASLPGVFGTGILVDFDAVTRNSTPRMGALESSLGFIWQGTTDTDFATATNWQNGAVPPDGVDISFAATPANDCHLDQNRTLKSITNSSTKKLVTNGKQLTITGNIVSPTLNQINASSALSEVVFAGLAAQSFPAGVFSGNTINALTINNSFGVEQNGDLVITVSFTLTVGTYSIGANTLSLNGSISAASGILSGGNSSNIIIGGNGASTILPAVLLNNLTINRASGITLGGAVNITGTLALNSGTLILGANTLTVSGNSPTRVNGNIDAGNANATIAFTNSIDMVLPDLIFGGAINNITINGAGITAGGNLTVNKILNLQSANPSATKGSLDMVNYTLNMGSNATTVGIGDVTGIVARYSLTSGVIYTFGNQYTSVSFIPGGTFPDYIKVKISIGAAPAWKPDAIKRVYDFIQSGGIGCIATISTRYLESELNGNDEDYLSQWTFGANGQQPAGAYDWGFTNYDIVENWVEIADVNIAYFPTAFGNLENTLATSVAEYLVWNGSVSTDWENSANWTPNVIPNSSSYIVIPDAATTPNDPLLPASSTINNIWLQLGSILNSNTNSVLTLAGNVTWINAGGTFNPSTGTVIFNNTTSNVSGKTSFYNLIIPTTTTTWLTLASHIKIAGDLTNNGILRTVIAGETTVEYNGTGNQTVVIPNSSTNRYYNLILSGGGTKTMPATPLNIVGDLIISGTANVTAASALTIGGGLEIQTGATFATGAFYHIVQGNFDNAGTFTATASNTINLNGTAAQKIFGGSVINFENLIIDNSAGVEIYADISVNEGLTLTSGTLAVGETTLTINGSLTKTAGFLDVNELSSLYFGGTSALTTPVSLFANTPSVNNLTINNSGGITFSSDLTVNGVLYLQSANPSSSTKGSLDMWDGSDFTTLSMGDYATTIGTGDVTGIVMRTSFEPNVAYSFGNPYTTVTFPNTGTLPDAWSFKIEIGNAPSWKPEAIKRNYDIIRTGGNGSLPTIKLHYLDSELNGNDEVELVFFGYLASDLSVTEYGRINSDVNNNWVSLSGPIEFAPTSFGEREWTLSKRSSSTSYIWLGSAPGSETDWTVNMNWSTGNIPISTSDVIIPAGRSHYPVLPNSTAINTINIELGATVNGGTSTSLTINGASSAWNNRGTFTPGTSTVIFTNAAATMSGVTNFYDIIINTGANVSLTTDNIMRVQGTFTNSGSLDATEFPNTIEYNGGVQTIINPNGATTGYRNLIISGSGTKTMPDIAMTVHDNFTISGTALVTAADSIIVLGKTTIQTGAQFNTGAHTHVLKGNFENNGTFISASGGTTMFNGSSTQSISGSSATDFDNLTVNNPLGVNLESSVDVNNVLTFNNGTLSVGANTLGINGLINNPSGNIILSSTSSLSFGGSGTITLSNNLFNGNPVINNLTVNRPGGVTLGNESITVNGTLNLTAGTFNIAANTLTVTGNSPVRTSGNINASNALATLVFNSTAAITLPNSVFAAAVNNLIIRGFGGVTAGDDLTVTGVLNLQSANPSSVKGVLNMNGYTLDMGPDATTIGQGDVSGIIRRKSIVPDKTYTFGHQYSSISFPDIGTLPSEISLKVTLGSAPTWKTGAINRIYDLIQTGGDGTQALIKNHYLDTELNGNNENKLIEWLRNIVSSVTIEYGRSDNNTTENWVVISNVNIGVFPSVFGAMEVSLAEYENLNLTWNGSISTSWVTATNWTPNGSPSDETIITIPDASTTLNDPTIPEIAICGKMIIQSGGILNSMSGGQLTVTGSGGAWVNNGTFAPGSGTVIFSNDDETEKVIIEGTSNFNNLILADKTWLQPATNSITNITGQISADSRCIIDFGTNVNTVGYNGSKSQTVFDPGEDYAYYNLVLSGDGLKTLPAVTFKIVGDLTLSENASTILTDDITVGANLTISNTAKLTVEAGETLTVNGSTSNSAGLNAFVLQSSVNGTASLIHYSDNVPATVERYISGNAEDWHFLSSPVSNQQISGNWLPSGTYGNGTGYDLYVWDEPTPCWVYQLNTTVEPSWPAVHPSTNFVPGKGYLYSVQAANPTKYFSGNLNNGSISSPVTTTATVDENLRGFNLIGNPYPSSIDWKAVSGWSRSTLSESAGGYDLWIWNPAANNYGTFNSASTSGTNDVTRYIAPMQGFFVRAASNGNVGFDNAVRLHEGSNQWKNAEINDKILIHIESNSGNGYDEVLLQFGFSANAPGAGKLFSPVKNAPSVFLPNKNESLSVRYLTNTEDNPSVPFSFKPGQDGEFNLETNINSDSFEVVILEDTKNRYFHNMKEQNTYRFNSSVMDNENRFVLHFTLDFEQKNHVLPANIYASGSNLVIDLSLVDDFTEIKVVDILGRTVFQKNLNGNSIHKLNLNVGSQIVIVCAKTNKAVLSRKIFVN